ncbi:hypothetical protein L2E82_26910 [Cichorium intybus]|uniref:Uncharacterized protein n=1 Tax=Cichorium intybus TaxID=13427 RepID=A0ACB9CRN5_CICIN|nr:hypothetical protein L2E82_26910 [Cichorium intybus]
MFFLISMYLSFPQGQRGPDKCFSSGNHLWYSDALRSNSDYCFRSNLTKSAGIQTVVLIPKDVGVLEVGSIPNNSLTSPLLTNIFKQDMSLSLRQPQFREKLTVRKPENHQTPWEPYPNPANSRLLISNSKNRITGTNWAQFTTPQDEFHLDNFRPQKPTTEMQIDFTGAASRPVSGDSEISDVEASGREELAAHSPSDMASKLGKDGGDFTNVNAKRISAGVLQSITNLLLLCAKQTIIASKKLKNNTKIAPGTPKKLISSISNKAIKLRHRMKKTGEKGGEYGNDGLWRREILMGDKCQPLDFSGVIYYDKDGNLLSELPMRSPRASPLPGYLCTPARSNWTTTPRRELSSR